MRIAALQCPPGGRRALDRLDAALAETAQAGADLLVTPEMLLSGYAIGAEAVAAAAAPTGEGLWRQAATLARRHGVALAVGGPLATPHGPANAAVLFDAAGEVRAVYAKTHLYGAVDRAQFVAGDALSPVVDLGAHRVALAICYDVEFPEVARSLALAGAEILLVPTANMAPFDSVCTRLVPARAEENGLAVVYANYVGAEADFVYCGRSCVSGPDGADLARAGAQEEVLLIADLAPDAVATARARVPYLAERRPDLYEGR